MKATTRRPARSFKRSRSKEAYVRRRDGCRRARHQKSDKRHTPQEQHDTGLVDRHTPKDELALDGHTQALDRAQHHRSQDRYAPQDEHASEDDNRALDGHAQALDDRSQDGASQHGESLDERPQDDAALVVFDAERCKDARPRRRPRIRGSQDEHAVSFHGLPQHVHAQEHRSPHNAALIQQLARSS